MRRLVACSLSVLCVLALAGAACGSDDEPETADDTRATTTTEPTGDATTTTTTAVDEVEAEILAAVDGYWDSYFVVNDPPNPDHPDLAKYRTGEALEQSRANVQERRDLGQVVRLPEPTQWASTSEVRQTTVSEALVTNCVVDDSTLVEADTGFVLNSSVATYGFEVTVVFEDDRWVVADLTEVSRVDGATSCAA